MSDNIESNLNSGNTEQQATDKILGRFENYSELEKAYKELESSYSKKENWEKKYTQDLSVPENYMHNDEIKDIEEDFLKDILQESKELGLNQLQFNKYAKSKYDIKTKLESERDANKFEIKENIGKFLKEDIGLTDTTINLLSKDDVEIYEKRYQDSLNTNSNVNNSYHSSDKEKLKKEAYRELKEAERSGSHFDKNKAFKKWSSYL